MSDVRKLPTRPTQRYSRYRRTVMWDNDRTTAYVAWYDRIAKLMVTQFTNHDTLRLAHASTLVFISKYRESTMLFNDASTRR